MTEQPSKLETVGKGIQALGCLIMCIVGLVILIGFIVSLLL
jgi:hypothetical protein